MLETLGRMLVGRIKPVTFAHAPPGACQNYLYLALAIAMLALALRRFDRNEKGAIVGS